MQYQVELARDGAEDAEPAEEGGRDERVASDADVEGACSQEQLAFWYRKRKGARVCVCVGRKSTISRFVKAVLGVAMAREDDDFVTPVLEPDGSVYDESFGASDAQVRVEKDDCLLARLVGRRSG